MRVALCNITAGDGQFTGICQKDGSPICCRGALQMSEAATSFSGEVTNGPARLIGRAVEVAIADERGTLVTRP